MQERSILWLLGLKLRRCNGPGDMDLNVIYEDGLLSNMGLWELSESIVHLSFKIFSTILYALLLDCCEGSTWIYWASTIYPTSQSAAKHLNLHYPRLCPPSMQRWGFKSHGENSPGSHTSRRQGQNLNLYYLNSMIFPWQLLIWIFGTYIVHQIYVFIFFSEF